MNTINMPGFTADASLYGAGAGDRYIMHLTMIANITDEVLPQTRFDICMRVWRRVYIGCRLDGGDIDSCSYLGEIYWDALNC